VAGCDEPFAHAFQGYQNLSSDAVSTRRDVAEHSIPFLALHGRAPAPSSAPSPAPASAPSPSREVVSHTGQRAEVMSSNPGRQRRGQGLCRSLPARGIRLRLAAAGATALEAFKVKAVAGGRRTAAPSLSVLRSVHLSSFGASTATITAPGQVRSGQVTVKLGSRCQRGTLQVVVVVALLLMFSPRLHLSCAL
jgi:hypothetical protein